MAAKNPRLLIHLDLLKSQTDSRKLAVRLLHFFQIAGRHILILIEALVIITLLYRLKLDGDLVNLKKEIDRKKDDIEKLRATELTIKQTQFKLASIKTFYANYVDYPKILKNLADQTPPTVKFINLSLEETADKIVIKLNAEAQTSSDISNFVAGLKLSQKFQDVILTTLSLKQDTIEFTINLSASLKS